MSTLLLRNAALVATFDDADRTFEDGGLFVRDGAIEAVGRSGELPRKADETIDASGMIVLPGLVNTHHHFAQTLTRNLPIAQNASLFPWLLAHYPIWGRITPEGIRSSTAVAVSELMLSGCTTSADHGYIWKNGSRIDDEIAVAKEMGFRLHASRGSMTRGTRAGGLPPDELVESDDDVMEDYARVFSLYHDPTRFAMTRIVLAPCSPFSVTERLMRHSAQFARLNGLTLQTHLCETLDEETYCVERFGQRPIALAKNLGWTGPDVWFAHAIQMNEEEIALLGSTRTGVAHCATSNMRLGSGIAPVLAQIRAQMRVGIGVDGSASNDCSNMLDEVRTAMLLQRVAHGADAMTAKDALRLATRGGAEVLGRDDIGQLAPNMAADFIGIRLDSLPLAGGAVHDALAALVFCRIPNVDLTVIAGRVRVREGRLVDVDLPAIIERHNHLAKELMR